MNHEKFAAMDQKDLDYIATIMDDEIREELHDEIAPCSPAKFLAAYCDRHIAKYGEEFCWT